jgi:hypothetical protein
MAQSIFTMGVFGRPAILPKAGIPVYRMTREQVDRDRTILKRLPVPPGMTVEYPYIVKIDGGEYSVQPDGTAMFFSYPRGIVDPPQLMDTRWMGGGEGDMIDMMNVTFQRAWFGGPFWMPAPPPLPKRPSVARAEGPLDGPISESIHAQWFAQIPVVNPAQPGYQVKNLGEAPVFCSPGYVPVPTGVPGKSNCVPFSPPSQMIGPSGAVGALVPPSYPMSRTFPVGPSWGWRP